MSSGLRNRRKHSKVSSNPEGNNDCILETKKSEQKDISMKIEIFMQTGSFWMTRIVMLRFLAFVYFTAFLIALHQNIPLIGQSGLLPVPLYLDRVKNHAGGSTPEAATIAPTIFWLFDYHKHTDNILNCIAAVGLMLSGFVMFAGAANIPIMFTLWVLYQSLVNVGQRWYSFGWESQLLETGFLAIFLCPLLSLRQMPKQSPTSFMVLMAYRWLIFRIMIGAGLIKIRGDKCWRDLTCMNYHYQTQPVPNPIAYFMHQEPEAMHKFETAVNHFVELLAPWLLLLYRPLAMVGGLIQIIFQVVLIISGNLSFLNWLTILPSLACFDDRAFRWMFTERARKRAVEAEAYSKVHDSWGQRTRKFLHQALLVLIAYLSVPVLKNLVSSEQMMNTSFDRLQLVNTYGAFGSVTKERTEVILQGTDHPDPRNPRAQWLEYEFKCKPGSINRRPCLISPYHYRLDWLMWFAAFQTYQDNEWLVHLTAKLLVNDPSTTTLIEHNPFAEGLPPKWIRAEHFRYNYTALGSLQAGRGNWWMRRRIGSYLPPVNLRALKDYMNAFGWPIPRKGKK